MKLCISWRSRVSEKFIFTVKCHRHVTNIYGLRPLEKAFKSFEQCINICKVLNSPLLIMETPPTLRIDSELLVSFFSSVEFPGIKVGLEARGPLEQSSFKTMMDMGIIHVTDISKEEPRYYDHEITYSRLFGKGVHNMYMFDYSEIIEISRKDDGISSKRVMLSFHGVRMYIDTARMKIYRDTGQSAPVTGNTGVKSFLEVISDAVFPASRQHLMERHGWKLFDLTKERRARVSEILAEMPDKTYHSLNELAEAVREILT
ncbi:MAG: DUF72 domain-containing protein [Nitrososphaerota archaeon]